MSIIKLKSAQADSERMGLALVDAGVISRSQLDICLRQQRSYIDAGKSIYIGQILLKNKFCSKADIDRVVNDGASGAKTNTVLFQQLLPVRVCRQYSVFPIVIEDGVLQLKAAKPLTEKQIDSIRKASAVTANSVRIIATDLRDINESLAMVIDTEHSFETILERMKQEEINGAMLRQAINSILIDAISSRASDIHITRKEEPDSWIAFRIDGTLRQMYLLPTKMMAALFTKLKSDCNMDASNVRRAQDGRISIENNGNTIDFRVSTQPIVDGEKMVLRVLNEQSLRGLEDLFPSQEDMQSIFTKIANITAKRGGLVIFSGPTGSGKTTSLYALVQKFKRDLINVMTVENPVEYVMSFSAQIEIDALQDQKFVDVERAILRQDPDVIVLGEIRDRDGMNAALQFAQSGHLDLATIHADNVPQTFDRIVSFVSGEDGDKALGMLANTLRVVVNQKLIPRLCTCSVETDQTSYQEFVARNNLDMNKNAKVRKAGRCPKCNNSGYHGRVSAHETMVIPMKDSLRKNISNQILNGEVNFSQIQDLEGVTMISRHKTLARLIAASIVDVKSASLIVEGEYA